MPKYGDKFLDHFQHPRNAGTLTDPDGVATVSNPACGDTTKLQIRVIDGVITEVRWQTHGCSTAIAASSAASEMIVGLPLSQAATISRQTIAEALGGLPPAKVHCSILAADALREAVADYRQRTAS
ncbi:MAG: iron-sulfur cluster assembly scaffold protein [Dehalococcoidia bacterium]|nr:iron-sulfur cluster assembly scaffold protein [Dehalococcoidia bacterium]